MSEIIIRGAREHNLDNVSLTLPHNRMICFTGVSGSGKSSLAFDTLYAEGQRRYVESLSSHARQYLRQLPKPDVENVSGLSPSISISQKTAGQNNRSTVGTITEISDYMRVLFARVATGFCPKCGREIVAQTHAQILERVRTLPDNSQLLILAPIVRNQKGRNQEVVNALRRRGYRRVRIDGTFYDVDAPISLDRQSRHSIDVVIAKVTKNESSFRDVSQAVETALNLGKGQMILIVDQNRGALASSVSAVEAQEGQSGFDFGVAFSDELNPQEIHKSRTPKLSDSSDVVSGLVDVTKTLELYFSSDYSCSHCGVSFERPTPQLFSFNNAQGMCPHCQGLGATYTFSPSLLIPDPSKSFQQGCIVPVGKWQDLGRWKQHVYLGVARAIEQEYNLPENSVLETAWEDLDPRAQHSILWGLGERSVTYVWQNGSSGHTWKDVFEGIIPRMLKQYEETSNRAQLTAMERFMRTMPCEYCHGMRLNEHARAFKLATSSSAPVFSEKKLFSLPELSNLSIFDLIEFLGAIELSEFHRSIIGDLIAEITKRLGFLIDVGLGYLSLGRGAPTLSGGETQRIRLAGQIGGGLVGVMYVLDEPSIGLHPRDNDKLIHTMHELRDLGNTVVVVEHDEDSMLAADYLVDFGPGPGSHGGQAVASGSVADVLCNQRESSLTARYLAGDESIPTPKQRRKLDSRRIVVRGATHHNLKDIDVSIPLGGVVCVTGVSGSGKSSLVNDIIREHLATVLNHANGRPGAHRAFEGAQYLSKLISIDQAPIGRTPRSNPATYIKLFDEIRRLYSETPEARAKGFQPGRFSFNVSGGRCEKCEGNGAVRLEMDFLADMWTTCSECGGRRFNQETLAIKYKGLSIDQTLELDVETALKHFENIPKIREKLQTLYDVGLGYMKLGQPSPTLSGGEAQRVKLAKELTKKSAGRTLYLLDEPTTGLHFADIKTLLRVLHSFADAGNTVLIVEHNLDVIKTADWVIDLGPEGGERGGYLVAEGTPEEVAEISTSHTGVALKEYFARDRKKLVETISERARTLQDKPVVDIADEEGPIIIRGAKEHNLQNVSVEIPRNKITVCTGPSGSGKSSLAIDVVYAEGRRRYMESLSSYARQFLGQIQKPDVEQTIGIAPSIAIEQKTIGSSPHSTVGTVTEILDYLRVLYARVGVPYCPDCNVPIGSQSTDQIVARVLRKAQENEQRLYIAAPITLEQNESFENLLERLRIQGFVRIRIDGAIHSIDEPLTLDVRTVHQIEVVVDRLKLKATTDVRELQAQRGRVADSVETALEWGKGQLLVVLMDDNKPERLWETMTLSQKRSCEQCGRAFEVLTPSSFSFNSPLGRCPHCNGLGVQVGANPEQYVSDPKLSLAQGALTLWSDFSTPITTAMMRAFARETDTPLDMPFERLDARRRRLLFSGAGDRWFDVLTYDLDVASKAKTAEERAKDALRFISEQDPRAKVAFRFQYKGIYPATEELSHANPYYRTRQENSVQECECSVCLGSRLRDDASAVRFHNQTLDQLCRTPLGELTRFFKELDLTALEEDVAGDIIDEVVARLTFLVDVGLDYLTLGRPAPTLSGGESQRIRLAAQIGGGLVGVVYVLDEPTIGLHQRDNQRLISAMRKLCSLGNTLLVVEHDQEVIASADYVIDFGPKAGAQGGRIMAVGSPEDIEKSDSSLTGSYLSGQNYIPIPINRRIIL
ncbi:MAG: excinuclease ABC subunit UvrA [Planctomycetia bacterium]|nr:excinuclease ABC subunit UvrA [Planctomycetia bacterium]